jgi:heme/copper-type cytochrome/quinol oxidase subunit 2
MKPQKQPPNAEKKLKETLTQIYQAAVLLFLFSIQMVILNEDLIQVRRSKYLIDLMQMLIFLTAAWLIFLIVFYIVNKFKKYEKNRND